MMPIRVQRKRTKGWRMPPNAKAVDRSTCFGNFAAQDWKIIGRAEAVRIFRKWVMEPEQQNFREWYEAELRGKNLACWCPLDHPCLTSSGGASPRCFGVTHLTSQKGCGL